MSDKIEILKTRAKMLARVRSFFEERNVIEVDCPLLSQRASVDAHIDLIPARYANQNDCFLHSSPEYGMKRLLVEGIGDIYQLSHVFRDGECGHKHNPEFMMIEWYRVGMPFEKLILETLDLIRLFLGNLPHQIISYRELFQKYGGFDYLTISEDELITLYPESLRGDKDTILNWILGTQIEPLLGINELTVLSYYPSTQAALAQTKTIDNEKVAERFEIYYKGTELCNGYHELGNSVEQKQRLEESNQHRLELGKNSLPIDHNFIQALQKGLPDCCGVAVGFDRLMMLKEGKKHIQEVIPFDWEKA